MMGKNKIKISVIEDIKDIALTIQSLINSQDDMECLHVFHNAEDAIQFIPHHYC